MVAPLFFVIALLAERAEGSEDIRDYGGIAFRAPILAVLFLIAALATLAMPGSANFAGEFLILLGDVRRRSRRSRSSPRIGVVLASVYALRMYIRSMHNRVGPKVESFELSFRDGLVLVPLVLAILAFALYPAARAGRGRGGHQVDGAGGGAAMTGLIAQATVKGPQINWEALSPAIALTAGACIVLLVGLARSAFVRRNVVPVLTLRHARRDRRARASGSGTSTRRSSPTRWSIDNLTLALTLIFVAGGIAAVLLAWRSVAAAEAGEGEYYALLLTSILGMVVLVAANDLVVLFIGFELLSIPLYVLCATHMKREQSLESGLKYLIIGSVGSATLLYGLALLYGAAGGTNYDDDRRGRRPRWPTTCCSSPASRW